MRLIDADALTDEIKHITGQDTIMWFYDRRIKREQKVNMAAFIERMPTIDPVKHGRWVCGCCDQCGYILHSTGLTNYCPNCGASMGRSEL